MARDPSLLSSHHPLAIAPARPTIAHVQLRDLLICPREQGLVNYVVPRAIVEQDLHAPGAPTRILAHLNFTPNSLTSLPVGQNDTLIAAGGQETEIHLSYHTPSSSGSRRTRLVWDHEDHLTGSINNSVLLTSLSLTNSNESSLEPRVGISNNDGSVRLYDVPLRVQSSRRKLQEVGVVRLDVPVNHSSISPDGRTLLSVGDSSKVYFHRITGGARITFSPITTLSIPPPDPSPMLSFPTSSLAASFSTAFSGDGSKFAVASQEGVVAVWDVRSTKVMKVFQTDKTRGLGGGIERSDMGNGGASGWLSDDPWEWTRGTKAPGWCVRSVKFNGGDGARMGKEVMAFTEHTSLVHIVDARTFETHNIIRVPTLHRPHQHPHPNPHHQSRPRLSSAPTRTSASVSSTSTFNNTTNAHIASSASSASSAPSFTTTTFGSTSAAAAPAGTSTSAPISGTASAQQRRIQRNLIRRLLPVSNARRTASSPAAVAAAATASSSSPGAGNGGTSTSTGAGLGFISPPRSSVSISPEERTRRILSSLSQSPSQLEHPGPGPSARQTRPAPSRPSSGVAQTSGGAPAAGALATPTPTGTGNGSGSGSGSGRPAIVQALGDAFRIPASAYSAPASIGDSTWRTLGGAVVTGRSASASANANDVNGARESVGAGAGAGGSGSGGAGAGGDGNAAQRAGGPSASASAAARARTERNTMTPRPSLLEWASYVLEREDEDGPSRSVGGVGVDVDADGVIRERDTEEGAALARRVRRAERIVGMDSASFGLGGGGGSEPLYFGRQDEEEEEEDEGDGFYGVEVEDVEEGARRQRGQQGQEGAGDEEEEGIVVVPDLGDRDVESEVHALLAVHGIASRLGAPAEGSGINSDNDDAGASGTLSRRRRREEADDEGGREERDAFDVDYEPNLDLGPPDADMEELEADMEEEEEENDETDRDTNTGSTHADYEYRLYGPWSRRTRRLAARRALGLGYGRGGGGGVVFDEAEEADVGMGVDEDEEDEDRMDVDGDGDGTRNVDVDGDVDGEGEEDADAECASSAANSRVGSRSSSPVLGSPSMIRNGGDVPVVSSALLRYGTHEGGGGGSPSSSSSGSSRTSTGIHIGTGTNTASRTRSRLEFVPKDDYDATGGYYAGPRSHPGSGSGGLGGRDKGYFYYDDLDIAGLCFDPWGERMYVAGVGAPGSVGSVGTGAGGLFAGAFGEGGSGRMDVGGEGVGAVVEWGVRGAEKRWWVDEGWM